MIKEMAYQFPQEIPGQPSRREQIFEVSVFLFFLIIPIVFGVLFFLFKPGKPYEPDFVWVAIPSMFQMLALTALIFFFVWRNKEPLARFGWNFKNGWRDVGLGIVLYFPLILGIGLLGMLLNFLWQLIFPVPIREIPQIPQFLIPQKGETLLALIFISVVAVTEEIIFRGYLLRRFLAILGSPTAAIFLSSAIFTLGHFYQGFPRMIILFFVGIFYAVLTLRRQSLVSPIVLHFLQNIMIVLIPLFGIDISALQPSHNIVGRLHGHEAMVNSVTFSPDSKLLASASNDKAIILWDVEKLQPWGTVLTGHRDRVRSVAFSPDGKLLASGSNDKTIKLWDIKKQQPLGAPLEGHKAGVLSVAFSPDGKLLASTGFDKTIIFWDVETRQPLGTPLTVHKAWASTVAFSPNGKLLASAGDWDKTVILWEVETRQLLRPPLTGHKAGVNSLAFSPSGKLLASAGGGDKTIILWDTETRQPSGEPLSGHNSGVLSTTFSTDGKLLASASRDGNIILWDVETRQPIGKPLKWHIRHYLHSMAFSPDLKVLAAGSSTGPIILVDVEKGLHLKRPQKRY